MTDRVLRPIRLLLTALTLPQRGRQDAKLNAQFAKSFPEAALKNVKWYPAVPPGIDDIEGKVLDRVKAAS